MSFDLPIHLVPTHVGHELRVDLHLGELGNGTTTQVLLDTGAGRNTVMLPDSSMRPGGAVLFSDWKTLYVPELGADVEFHAVHIPEILAARIRQYDEPVFIINPWLIIKTGFTVVDLRSYRLVGFLLEEDMRRCYGSGMRSDVSAAEQYASVARMNAQLDGKINGRIELDTGGSITKFFAPAFAQAKTKAAPERLYYTITGERVVPNLSLHHTIRIGDVTRDLAPVAIEIVPRSDDDSSIARLCLDDMKDTVLIFPPPSAHYWEMIF